MGWCEDDDDDDDDDDDYARRTDTVLAIVSRAACYISVAGWVRRDEWGATTGVGE